MDKKKIALIVVVLFLLIGLGSFVFANPDQDNDLEGPGVSEDGGSGDGEVIDGTEPTATPEEENDDSATETDPITTYGNGGNGTGTGAGNGGTTGAGNDGTTGGVGNTDMSQYNDARRIIEELENRVNSMKNKDDSNNAVDYRTETDIIEMVNNLPEGTEKDELMNRLDAINKVLDDTTAPVITGINNNDVTKENVTINVTDDNDVTITATLDGEEIEFTTPLTEEGNYVVTVTDKNFNTTTVKFTIDKTPIALDWLYVLNNSGTDYKVIGDGQKLYVELVFTEEFTSTPMIQIGNAEAVEMSCHWTNWQTEKQYFKCDATITIDGSTMGLENGKEVPVKITNVLDAAGNETVLTNENITETEKYGHVIYDKQAPEMEVLRLTNVSRKDENGAWLQVAKAGDFVRVIVQFNENLATLPTLKVNGTEVGVMKYDSNMQSYTYDYKVTENDVNGVMQIEISNYADAAGNVGDTLTNKDINHDTQNQVVIDTVAPEYAAMGIFNWTNNKDGSDLTYATKDEHIRLYVSFPEMLATNPKVDIYGMDGKVTTLDLSYSEAAKFYFVEFDTTDEFALPEGKINFKVYGYADEAGNVGADLTQDMTTSKEYPYVIYDSVAPGLNFNNGFITDAFTVVATDDNFDYMTVQYYDGREMKTITENTFTLDAEGDNIRYNIKAYDKAGNVSEYADIYLDTQDPALSGTGINGKNEVKVKDGGYYKNATIHFEDGSLKKVVLVNEDGTEEVLEEYEDNYTTSKMVFDRTFPEDGTYEDGTYTIKAIDRKGNVTTVSFTIDQTDPVVKAANILVDGDVNEQTEFYATTGDTIYSYVRFSEELKQNPKFYLVNNGTEYEVSDVAVTGPNDNGEYTYSIRYTITEDNTMTDGQIEMKVTGISDKAGNTIDDITKPTNGHIVHLDRVEPMVLSLRANSSSKTDNSVGILGQSVGIYLLVDEELAQNPTFIINGKEYAVNQPEVTSAGNYKYSVVETVTTDMKEGPVEFTITNIVDKAGNVLEGIIDQTDANQTLYIDNSVPETTSIEFKNIDSYKGNENYANVGDRVWLYLVFDERLSQDPTVTINGQEVRRVQYENGDNWNQPWEKFVFEYVVPEGASEGEITFHVSNIVDKNGNVGLELNQTATLDKVIVDTTAAGVNPEYWNKTLEVGDSFTEPNVTFTDNYTASDELEINHWCNVDTEKAGNYQCYYSSTDKAGNSSSNSISITVIEKEVIDNEDPVIMVSETGDVIDAVPLESGKNYSSKISLFIYDNSGSATVYFDFNNGYTSPVDLMENVQPLNIFNATEDNPYKLTIPKASGLSVYVVDGNNKAAFVTRVTIN